MCNRGAVTSSVVPDQVPAEQITDKGAHAAAVEASHDFKELIQKEEPAETAPVTPESNKNLVWPIKVIMTKIQEGSKQKLGSLMEVRCQYSG